MTAKQIMETRGGASIETYVGGECSYVLGTVRFGDREIPLSLTVTEARMLAHTLLDQSDLVAKNDGSNLGSVVTKRETMHVIHGPNRHRIYSSCSSGKEAQRCRPGRGR